MIAAMHAPPSTDSAFQRFKRGLTDLMQASNEKTRGHASFVVGDDGDWVHTYTVITVEANKGETLEAFHQRVRRDYGMRSGDMIDILDNGGKMNVARLKLVPRD